MRADVGLLVLVDVVDHPPHDQPSPAVLAGLGEHNVAVRRDSSDCFDNLIEVLINP